MASLTCDKRGVRRLVFNDSNVAGGRRTISLGDTDKKTAESIRTHVERLIAAKEFDVPLADETARWLIRISDVLHVRLVNAALVAPRNAAPAVTLVDVIDTFTMRRGPSVKPGTKLVWAQARRHLLAAFSANPPAASLTPADADDYRRKLRTNYSEAYTAKMTIAAKSFFRDAVRRRVLSESPFADTATGSQRNPDRQRFVDVPTIQKAIDAAPDAQWRLLIAFAPFGGLRVPSEPLTLRWADVNWAEGTMTVQSPKTAHHPGGASRVVPIFAELRPLLMEAFEAAEPGQKHVIHQWRTSAVNLRTQFERILSRAGLTPWPRLWQNLRASRATELADRFPGHLCAVWLGHTDAVADKHYRQMTAAHLAQATGIEPALALAADTSTREPTRKATQQPSATARIGQNPIAFSCLKTGILPLDASGCEPLREAGWERQDSNL